MTRMIRRIRQIDFVIGEPTRRADECRTIARNLCDALDEMDRGSFDSRELQPMPVVERAAMHDHVRATRSLSSIGEAP